MNLLGSQRAELIRLMKDRHVSSEITRRAQMILWEDEGMAIGQIAKLARVSRPTLDLWRGRYREEGIAGLVDRDRPGGPQQILPQVRGTIVAMTKKSPPEHPGDLALVKPGDGGTPEEGPRHRRLPSRHLRVVA